MDELLNQDTFADDLDHLCILERALLTLVAFRVSALKDGAYYCYCAYVLRISRYSDFLSPMLTNTGVFLRGLKLSGESRS